MTKLYATLGQWHFMNSSSTLRELYAMQAKNPSRDLPIAILGSLSVATILYILMCLAITMMIPYYLIDVGAPFSAAFRLIPNWHWVAYLVDLFRPCCGLCKTIAEAIVLLELQWS